MSRLAGTENLPGFPLVGKMYLLTVTMATIQVGGRCWPPYNKGHLFS